MWQQIVNFTRHLLTLSTDTKKNKEDVKSLQEENKELRHDNTEMRQEMNQQRVQLAEVTRFAERILYELQRTRESAENDKKMLRLEMENLLLRYGHSIPPSEPKEKPKEPKAIKE